MKLLKELITLNEGKKNRAKTKQMLAKLDKAEVDKKETSANNNLVAKHMRAAGNRSTPHEIRKGAKAPRASQKRNWKKETGY